MLPPLSRAFAGAAVGAAAWPALHAALPFFPEPLRFLIAWSLFTFGPGVAVSRRLTGDLDPLRRAIVVLGIGSAATPVLIDLLGRAHLIATFPYVAVALVGAGVATWNRPPATTETRTSTADLVAAAAVVGRLVR